jgi:lactoylglutathione lyase
MSAAALDVTTGHIGLNVSDLSRSIGFYRDVFGFELVSESTAEGRRFAFLGRAGALVLTLWEQSAGRFAPDRPGLHHLSFQASSIDEVERAHERLRSLGVRLFHGGIVPHGEGQSSGGVFFEDPDGLRLEIFAAKGVAPGVHAPHGDSPTCGFF